jgi:hypothetical protein
MMPGAGRPLDIRVMLPAPLPTASFPGYTCHWVRGRSLHWLLGTALAHLPDRWG